MQNTQENKQTNTFYLGTPIKLEMTIFTMCDYRLDNVVPNPVQRLRLYVKLGSARIEVD